MASYKAPLNDMNFVLFDVLKADGLSQLPGFEDATEEMIRAVLEEASKFAENVFQPTNQDGDIEGCQYDPETHNVTTPKGFKEAYKTFAEGGWSGLSATTEYGGQGLPHLLKIVVDEMACSTNLSLGMYPGLSHGAIDALTEHAEQELKDKYLPQLISGEWTGTMCLTEPQCGTDLGLIRTKAEPQADGSYNISGTKIWITGGEHDMVDNIVHLVLAKLPGAPDSSKGISLFLVPKFLEDGSRNPAFCGGLEHKMGIKGSATCVMNFEGAKGWLIGKENEGLKCMFTMMNAARIMVGVQGLGLAEKAYQISLGFAKERLQSRSLTGPKSPDEKADPIIVHPDVRRMLMQQKVFLEGARCMAYFTGYHLDLAHKHDDESVREESDDIVQIMTPIIKAYLTDEGFFSTDQALQSMGGSGFTQDWEVEQLLRDGRIARIYEGTNGIQALDLTGRKLTIKGGRLPKTFFKVMNAMIADLDNAEHQEKCKTLLKTLQGALMWLGQEAMKDPEQAGAAATPLLKLFSLCAMSVMWATMAKKANEGLGSGKYEDAFYQGKIKAAEHFFRLALSQAEMHKADIEAGKSTLMDMAEGEF
ncbi:acyl-CoA dehydrogenase [Bermanella marisrubri]|uniref:3-methylmercaptopropionyl-CoA dehydrogenase n=1 Tax=Bermanella marisrubri TaxID=207949 RepID=Q1N3Q8_9GAMM|nr:acyl-CoA dehydrogenase C-terminal domain-containing protein [Bermanella marisrubri]EAT12816.1 acyl-CoA dehydrogenase family protein [Oceanobacter sp. RED65] [Bermanella marisrubri]QIZ83139.1 acyl-CoA dehydrogenase [Bermanella marisrubri]